MCGKLEQISIKLRNFLYYHTTRNALEIHGRPTFAIVYNLVDYCHSIHLYSRNGSFEIGPTESILCSYSIHLPYGYKVVLRLQMGTGPTSSNSKNTVQTLNNLNCEGMSLNLEDGDLKWNHCSRLSDPLRSVQIVSENNIVRLNISVKPSFGVMWLKVWWMDKAIDEVVGNCDYGWVASGEFCVAPFRDMKRPWREAEEECLMMGGHLASILNEREQNALDRMLINA